MADPFNEDPVRLKLAGQEVPIAQRYTVRCGVLEVPAQFEMTVGHGGNVVAITTEYPPGTPFELLIGNKRIQVGETDGYTVNSDETTVTIHGRDLLARIHDFEIEDEATFAEKTYAELVKRGLKAVGLGDKTLTADNAANRKAITGKDAVQLEKKTVADQTETGVVGGDKETVEVTRTIKGEVGQTWLEFFLPRFRKAGLFMWSTHDGDFVLSQPNGAQKPNARIIRRRGSQNNANSVIGCTFKNDTKPRHSVYRVCGRSGGGKHGRATFLEVFYDEEMVARLNPDPAKRKNGGEIRKTLTIKDPHCTTPAQAKLLARRKCAEERRAGWELHYKVAGHSTPAIGGGRVVWQPDTTVEVVDDELGVHGVMYVESVAFSRTPDTLTELHLLRIDDLVFAEEAPEVMKKRPKLQVRRGVTTVERASHVLQGTEKAAQGAAATNRTVWTTDVNTAVGAPVIIDPEHDSDPNKTTKVTLKPLVFGSQADVGVAAGSPIVTGAESVPTKPGV